MVPAATHAMDEPRPATAAVPESPSPHEPGLPGRWVPVERGVFALAAALAVGALFFRLGVNPPGLNIDETALGYNARAVARTGADEFGVRWPLFFRALEDYKSPVLVYTAVVTTGLLGNTPFALRLSAALFALGGCVALWLLLRRLTGRPRLARWLALLALLAPSTFSFGRHTVTEANTVLLMLCLAFLALERAVERPSAWRAALAGAALALCTYCYTTQRLFAPMMIVVAGLCFLLDRKIRRTVWGMVIGAAVVLAPYAAYLVTRPGALTKRFDTMSIFRDHAGPGTVAARFLDHYYQHLLSFDFLFRSGDTNIRHNIGVGLLPLWLLVPLVMGLAALWRRRAAPMARFYLALVVLSPIPVSLTYDAWPHASRMLHLFPLVMIAAALALSDWIETSRPRPVLLAALTSLALLESGQFLARYFVEYPARAQWDFDNGHGEALRIVVAERGKDAPVFLPETFFSFGGTLIKFWSDADPARLRQVGLNGLGFTMLRGQRSFPEGAIVVTDRDLPPPGGQPHTLLGVSRSERDQSLIWSVYRVNAGP
jgi:4-amino-4-deoxy-L-arabinose transferase-like glycosyltransferase